MSTRLLLPHPDDIEFTAMRAQGAGGQHVNKVSSAVQLRFDIRASSLPPEIKARLLAHPDHRINDAGVVVIKAQTHRSQGRNRADALHRLQALIEAAQDEPPPRRATQPTRASQQRRLKQKSARAAIKRLRGRADVNA